MLRTLDIRDILIIDHLELGFQPGLNVLTGETGAGKSILLDSLGFVLGWRGRAELVRSGAKQGEVTAIFDLPEGHAAHAILDEAGLPTGDELILRRVNRSDGRKTAWVNDRRCSGEVLRALSETLIELHGQHDDRGLLDPKGHMAVLDAFLDKPTLHNAVLNAWKSLSASRKTLGELEAAIAAVREEEDFLRHAVAELDALDPMPGEEAVLDVKRRKMQGAEKIRDDVARAFSMLGFEGAEGVMSEAVRWLDGVADKADGQLDAPLAALSRAMEELGDASAGVEQCLDNLEFNPADLEACEERLFAIRALARKHNVTPDELGSFAIELRQRLEALDAGDAQLGEARAAVRAAEASYESAAQDLSEARGAAAMRLDAAVTRELAPLKMDRAVFTTEVSETAASGAGRDAVAFTVATNPGAPSGPLNKIASGGELSRFLLALKVCLSDESQGITMIFDEIDRGVGGATADAVGRRLASLADGGQVLVVTHSPQVAALGGHHWRVEKRVENDATLSTVVPLDEDERIDEIARMISGDTISDEARGAARSLLVG
ncbi:DNA repair protein RecN [Planktotalea sp.]|uniref:DNA repair protein RecN n=1 Tax=Planktotalea sp. TaxID=2029877 RepID=UPI003D6AFB20